MYVCMYVCICVITYRCRLRQQIATFTSFCGNCALGAANSEHNQMAFVCLRNRTTPDTLQTNQTSRNNVGLACYDHDWLQETPSLHDCSSVV